MIHVDKIVKHYKTVKAVDSLSFDVKQGEIFALLGPNGAGKTTTVRMIMQILQPDSGQIVFDEAISAHGNVVRSMLGYLPEERGLYQDIPILKVLQYFASLRGTAHQEATERAKYWLERLNLWERRNEKISTLSKGNQQKIQFVASILHNPKFAILDEPFSGFDPINQELVSDLIKELRNEGMTILLSAHQMQLVERIADRILVLNKGKIHLEGTLQDIKKSFNANAIVKVQFALPVSATLIENTKGVENVKSNAEETEFTMYVSKTINLNELMSSLTQYGEIVHFNTETVGLHDIFVQSIH